MFPLQVGCRVRAVNSAALLQDTNEEKVSSFSSESLEGQLVRGAMVNVTQASSLLYFLWRLLYLLLKHVQQSRTNWGRQSFRKRFTHGENAFLKNQIQILFCGCHANGHCFFLTKHVNYSTCILRIVVSAFQTVRIDTSDKALIRGLTPDWFSLASFLLSTGILSWCNKSNYQRPLPRPRDREESICYQTHTHTSSQTHIHTPSNTVQYVFTVSSSPATEWQPS